MGEASRSGYEHAINHLDDYRAKHEDSHMWGYALSHHVCRMDLSFKFSIVKTFQKALTRQISETVRTRQRGEDLLLNKKGVFNDVRSLSWLYNIRAKCGRMRRTNLSRPQMPHKQKTTLRI